MFKAKWSYLVLAFGLVFASWAQAQERDPMTHFFESNLNDYHEELQRAKDEHKKAILLFFVMDECPFCDRMKKTILNQSQVQDYFKEHFLSFVVDIEGDVQMIDFAGNEMSEKDFAQKVHRVRATPVTAFFDLEGNKIVKFTGPVSNAQEFMLLGEYVASGAYTQQPFNAYKRAKGQ